jgi:hypothetical protein
MDRLEGGSPFKKGSGFQDSRIPGFPALPPDRIRRGQGVENSRIVVRALELVKRERELVNRELGTENGK